MTDTDEKNPRGAIRGHIVVLSPKFLCKNFSKPMETWQNINFLPEIRNGCLPSVNQTSPPS